MVAAGALADRYTDRTGPDPLRLIIDIADHELLGDELAMRGGTCLHKLYLPVPARYSEDPRRARRRLHRIADNFLAF